MATSESDDFESADEEFAPSRRNVSVWSPAVVDSESDDDTELTSTVQATYRNARNSRIGKVGSGASVTGAIGTAAGAAPVAVAEDSVEGKRGSSEDAGGKAERNAVSQQENVVPSESRVAESANEKEDGEKDTSSRETHEDTAEEASSGSQAAGITAKSSESSIPLIEDSKGKPTEETLNTLTLERPNSDSNVHKKERVQRPKKTKEPRQLGAKKLGAKIIPEAIVKPLQLDASGPEEIRRKALEAGKEPPLIEECWEELEKSNTDGISEKSRMQASAEKSGEEESRSKQSRLPQWDNSWDDPVKPANVEECWEEPDALPLKSNVDKISGESSIRRSAEKSEKVEPPSKSRVPQWDGAWDNPVKPANVDECWEDVEGLEGSEVPDELKSNKKFKEVFKLDGWEGLEDDVEIPDTLTDEMIQPILDKLSSAGERQDNTSGGWGNWGGWGVSSLLQTGVSTLSNHVSQGLSMLEDTIGVPDPVELANQGEKDDAPLREKKSADAPGPQLQNSFGFGNLMSGVSSITKLVESTGSKVISGGLDTLETIGKKTMEVLQDGDPGLKKKRAFFLNEGDKPILSHILREAKDKADTVEKTLEERQMARKVHFESLFDDYQGLVHLEALEMLSKQCNVKIQQHLISLEEDELSSMEETLDEVKELCDLGDEDEEEENDRELKERLTDACKDLGINVTYDKLLDTWKATRAYISDISSITSSETPPSDREVFQRAVSTLAEFTAFSVERFHKIAELLLIKERRSTVNEADALVELTRILSGQIGVVANLFCERLNELSKASEQPDAIKANMTTVFSEAANASSYIQDAFTLLIPILQVGAI